MNKKLKHYEESMLITANPNAVFEYVDDHKRFSSHMSKSSWMMGGGRMDASVDEGQGQKMGSHIILSGKAFGIPLSLDEVVTLYNPPRAKAWKTVGEPKLLIIGSYSMGIEIKPQNLDSQLLVYINYDLPKTNVWLGYLLSGFYAKWCVRQMINGARDEFNKNNL